MLNKLLNGKMDEFDHQKDEFGNQLNTVKKPKFWTGFWYGDMMEYKPVEIQYQNRIRTPPTAAQWFLKWKTPNGGLYQTVTGLVPGATYRLTGWVQAWCVYENGNDVPGSMELRVDPYGGVNPDSASNIASSPTTDPHNKWVEAAPVEFVAMSDRATVFIISVFSARGVDMNCYVDDVVLQRIDDGEDPTPDPEPVPEGDIGKVLTVVQEALDLVGELKVGIDLIRETLDGPWTIVK